MLHNKINNNQGLPLFDKIHIWLNLKQFSLVRRNWPCRI